MSSTILSPSVASPPGYCGTTRDWTYSSTTGKMRSEKQLSVQGFQSVFATNHLGHFALTASVFDALLAGDQPRVVTVGSNLTQRMKVALPLDDLSQQVSAGKAYVGSKLANLMFAHELERRLRTAGSPVRSLAAHPGVAATPLQKQVGNPLEWVIGRALGLTLGRSAAAGAIPLLFAATSPEAPTGVFLGPGLRKRDVRVHAEALVPPANDVALARRLWTVSQQATGQRLLDE